MGKRIKQLLFLLLILFAIFLVIPFFQKEKENDFKPVKKKLELKQSKIFGYEKKKLSWEVVVDYVWAGRSRFLYRAEKIQDGRLYDKDGAVVVDEIRADSAKVNSKSKTLSAFNNIYAVFKKRDKKDPLEDNIRIHANELKFYSISKKTYLKHNIVIEQGEAVIRPKRQVELDNNSNIAYLINGFTLTTSEIVVTGNKMIINIDKEFSEIPNGISGIRKRETTPEEGLDPRENILRMEDTLLNCGYLYYTSDKDNIEIIASDNLSVKQKDKILKAEKGYHNKNKNIFTVEGDIEFKADSLIWLVNEEKKDNFKNREMEEALYKPVVINCDKINFYANDKKLFLLGDVVIKQDDQQIRCQRLEYNDAKSRILLIGGVTVIRKGQDTIQGNKVSIDIENESFQVDDEVSIEWEIGEAE